MPDAELNSVLSRNAKRNYKKAQANKLVIDTSGDVNIFYDIVKKNREKFNATPTHTLKDLEYLKQQCSDKLFFHLLYFEEQAIAGLCIFQVNATVSNIFYMCHNSEFDYLKPCDYLIIEYLKLSYSIGIKEIDFGPSNFDKDIKESLLNYKLGFNGTIKLRRHFEKIL